MLETILSDYGMTGIFISCLIAALIYMAKKDDKRDKVFIEVINNNTKVMSAFVEMKKKCEKRGR
jgi:hypothetical protein